VQDQERCENSEYLELPLREKIWQNAVEVKTTALGHVLTTVVKQNHPANQNTKPNSVLN